jgi:class 3 adenylate cyclase
MNREVIDRDDAPGVLSGLGRYEPDGDREALVRARCRAALEACRRREAVRGEPGWRFAIGLALGPAVVGVLCAVYLFEVISRAMQLYRF